MEWSKGSASTLAYVNALSNNSINCALANNIKCTPFGSNPFIRLHLILGGEPGCEYVIGLCGVIGNFQSGSIIGS